MEGDRVYVHFGTLGTAALSREGKILWTNQELRYELLARNSLPGRTLASIAVADGAIFLRTATHLYRIEQR